MVKCNVAQSANPQEHPETREYKAILSNYIGLFFFLLRFYLFIHETHTHTHTHTHTQKEAETQAEGEAGSP